MINSRETYDVIVVGAGPAGSSAAFELARHGVRVALLEKEAMPRYKTCGGGLVLRARMLFPFDVSEAVDRECRRAELNLADADMHFSVTREYPLVSMTMRSRLDYLLFREASRAGARVVDDCRVIDVKGSGGMVEVVTSKGAMFSRFLVVADGARSTIAARCGWRGETDLMPLVEWEVPVSPDVLASFSSEARFEFGPVPAGYAWIFPKSSHLSVGIGSYVRGRLDLKGRLRRFLETEGITPCSPIEHHGHYIPTRIRREGFVKDRIVLAGDAAGFVDPVTGEGLTYAVLSGQAAARALIAADFEKANVNDAYRAELKVRVLRELRWATLLAALLYRSVRVRNLLFERYGYQFSEGMADLIAGAETYASLCHKRIGLRRLLGLLKTPLP